MAAIPPKLRQAFLSAEDKNFYRHPGIDPTGIARAAYENLQAFGTNRRPQGARPSPSRCEELLLTNEVSLEAQAQEAILAFRIEQAFTKDRILELYLNEIFLGRRSYGVAAAALTYFDKALDDLTLAEAAFLAALPKAPATYDPDRQPGLALGRRNYVLGGCSPTGAITVDEHDAAMASPSSPARARASTTPAQISSPRRCAASSSASSARTASIRRAFRPHHGRSEVASAGRPGAQDGLAAYDRSGRAGAVRSARSTSATRRRAGPRHSPPSILASSSMAGGSRSSSRRGAARR
jgi:membrane peptidoglycan carboxypeptidase